MSASVFVDDHRALLINDEQRIESIVELKRFCLLEIEPFSVKPFGQLAICMSDYIFSVDLAMVCGPSDS